MRGPVQARKKFEIYWKRYTSLFILIGEIIICAAINEYFLTPENLINVLRQISIVTIMAFGQTMLIIAGQIDLSVSGIAGMAGVFACAVFISTHNLILAVVVALILGGAVGAVNGVCSTFLSTPPFIVTLAMQQVAFGIIYIYTNGQNIYQIGNFSVIGQGSLGVIPVPIIIMFGIFLLAYFLLNHTKFGRYLYAIGGNEKAAIASGVRVNKNKMVAFILSGCLAGLSGVILMSRINSGIPSVSAGTETDSLMATIIGGTSFTGGIGTALGTLIGSITIGILSNILNLMGVQSYVQQVLKGFLIIAAVVLDVKTRKRGVKRRILTEESIEKSLIRH